MTTFELIYKIEDGDSWRAKESINIKSNLSEDELIECKIAKSLINKLKTDSALLDPTKLLLSIAETQRRGIQTNLEEMDDLALQAKVRADKAHEILSTIAEEAEVKYEEIEKKFSATEKRFNEKMTSTAKKIKNDLDKLTEVEEKLKSINNYDLEKLIIALNQLISLVEVDPELVKLVLEYKK